MATNEKGYEKIDYDIDDIETEELNKKWHISCHTEEINICSSDNRNRNKDFTKLDYQCSQCKYGLNSRILLEVHMKTQHGMKYNPDIKVHCPSANRIEDPADLGYPGIQWLTM